MTPRGTVGAQELTPAIGPPTRDTERRQSPAVLSPAVRQMDVTGARRRSITVVSAAGHLLNNNFTRELRDDVDVDVIGQAATATEAQTVIRELMPDVALVGIDLGRDTAGAIALCRTLQEDAPTVAVVAVAENDRAEDLFAFVRSGAISCFFGRSSPMTLRRTIVGAHRRESVVSSGVARAIVNEYQRMEGDDSLLAPAPALTPTEEEVLRRLAEGESPSTIAQRHTVVLRMIGLHTGYTIAKLHRCYHDDAEFRLIER